MKRWKFRKVTPEIIEEMKVFKSQGMSYTAIGERYGIDAHTVRYWIDEEYQKTCIERAKNRGKQVLSDAQKERRKAYIRDYIRKRYHEDPEFKERFLGHSKRWQEKQKKEGGETNA